MIADSAGIGNITVSSLAHNLSQFKKEVKAFREKNNIRYQERSTAPTFYSKMGKVIDDIKPLKMGANGVVPYLKGKGVKNEEIKWSGIEAFLEGKKSVSKDELQEFVAGSQLQVEEVVLSKKTDGKFKDWQTGIAYDSLTDWKVSAWIDAELSGYSADEVEYKTEENGNVNLVAKDTGRVIASGYARTVDTTKWSEYKLKGGTNYREITFKMPNSTYTNNAMKAHWGNGAELSNRCAKT